MEEQKNVNTFKVFIEGLRALRVNNRISNK